MFKKVNMDVARKKLNGEGGCSVHLIFIAPFQPHQMGFSTWRQRGKLKMSLKTVLVRS